MKYWLKLI